MSDHLPLGWIRASVSSPQLNLVSLPLSRFTWIPTAEIPPGVSFAQVYNTHLQQLPTGFLLQFCNAPLSRYVVQRGGQTVQIGQEAVLDLPQQSWNRPSLQALVRRGLRWGRVTEAIPNEKNRHKLHKLLNSSARAKQPRLSLAYRTDFTAAIRCFAFVSPDDTWLAAITLSRVSAGYLHTELMVRHRNAPVGVMEALIGTVANRLLAQRITHWSLGGVPFAVAAHPSPVPTQFYKSMLVNKLGNSFHFAYNSRGLFKFKNKFSPTWQPLYLCAAPKFPWRGLLDLAIKMRYIKLIAYSTLASLPGVSNPGFVD